MTQAYSWAKCFPGVTSCKTQLWAKCLFPYKLSYFQSCLPLLNFTIPSSSHACDLLSGSYTKIRQLWWMGRISSSRDSECRWNNVLLKIIQLMCHKSAYSTVLSFWWLLSLVTTTSMTRKWLSTSSWKGKVDKTSFFGFILSICSAFK